MFFLLILLSLIAGLLLISKNTFFYSLAIIGVLVALSLRKYKLKKKILIFLILSFIGGILFSIIKIPLINKNLFLIIEKHENYLIGFNGINKVYLYSKNNEIPLFSLINLTSSSEYKLKFATLESSFDFNEYLKNKGVIYGLYINKFNYLIKFPLDFNKIKDHIVSKFDSSVSSFVSSLLFKETNYDSNLSFKLKNLNLIYIFSFSGIYLNFVLYSLKKLLSLFIKEKNASIFSFGIVSFYLLLNINNYLVIRVIYFYLSRHIYKYLLNKPYDKITHLSLFCLISLLIDHYLIYSYSFIIYLIYSIFNEYSTLLLSRFKKIKKKFISSILMFIVMLPFTVNFNNSINIFSLIVQFFLIPIMKLLFILGLISVYGIHFSFIDYIFKYFIIGIGYISFDKLSLYISSFNQYVITLYYILLIIIIYFLEVNNKKRSIKYILMASTLIVSNLIPFETFIKDRVSFINVGQGDATLITYKNNNFLIDTGGLTYQDIAKNCLIPYFKKNNIYKIDALFITHNDYDHVGALESLKRNFRIGNIYSYNDTYPITVKGLKIENLNIYKNMWNDENLKSCVFKFKLQDKTFLIMGDAPKEIEKMIIKDNKELTVDYLKVGHHGSNTSTDESFISSINPKVAIISCGYKNKFNHPSKETIDILLKYKISIKRTDIDDTITIFI